MVRPIRPFDRLKVVRELEPQAQSSTEAHSKSGPDPSTHRQAQCGEEDRTTMLRVTRREPLGRTMVRYSNHEALEGQAHHPGQSRRTDGVSKGEKRKLSPLVEYGDSNSVFDIT